MLKVYTYAKCSTCRKAVKFLRDHGIEFKELPIRETPPSLTELKQVLKSKAGNIRALFNTSGLDYKALGLSAKLPAMSEAEALNLLVGNGNLVKRPFGVGRNFTLVGFDEGVEGSLEPVLRRIVRLIRTRGEKKVKFSLAWIRFVREVGQTTR